MPNLNHYRRVWVVFKKELLDTLRDRRTVVAMIIVPLVLYPALMMVMVEALKTETGRRKAERYSVIVPTQAQRTWLMDVLQHDADEAEKIRAAASKDAKDKKSATSDFLAYLVADQFDIGVAPPNASLWDEINNQTYQVGLIVEPPPDAAPGIDHVNRNVQIIYRDTDARSEFLYHQLARILDNEAERIIRARVAQLPGGEANLTPLYSQGLSTSSPQQQFAKILAMLVPFLLVIMSVTGALYPAIDLTAGERERGTLETLAVSPVPVGQIVAGKFGVIVAISMISTALNLGSMSAVIHFSKIEQLTEIVNRDKNGNAKSDVSNDAAQTVNVPAEKSGQLSQADYMQMRRHLEENTQRRASFITRAAPIVLLAMLPFSILSAAVMLAACSFARTFKEAQYYMMPVMMAAILPAMVVSYMPTIKLEGILLVIPVANIVVLIRELFLGHYEPTAIAVSMLSTAFYAAAAVTMAAKLYAHEAVLFSDVGNYVTLIKRRFIKPAMRPGAALALVSVALCFPFYFYWQSYWTGEHTSSERFRVVIAAGQILILALPVIILSWYLKLNLRETFSLNTPRALPTLGALIMAPVMLPVSLLLFQIQMYYFPALQSGADLLNQQSEFILRGPMWSAIVVFALVPAICEELLFRGFLTSGLRERMPQIAVVICVGVIFGLFHISIEKILITSLMGMLLTYVCIATRSILPSILMHVANNGLGIAAGYPQNGRLRELLAIPAEPPAAGTIIFNTQVAICLGIFLVGFALTTIYNRSTRSERSIDPRLMPIHEPAL